MGIKAGRNVTIIDIGDAIVPKPVNEESLKRLQGMLKGTGVLKSLMEERRKDAEREQHGYAQDPGC